MKQIKLIETSERQAAVAQMMAPPYQTLLKPLPFEVPYLCQKIVKFFRKRIKQGRINSNSLSAAITSSLFHIRRPCDYHFGVVTRMNQIDDSTCICGDHWNAHRQALVYGVRRVFYLVK